MNIDEKLDEIIKLYPGKTWHIEYSHERYIGGELVPYCFVYFGNYNEELEMPDPLYINKTGEVIELTNEQKIEGKPIPGAFECACFYYETDINFCITEIYNEIMKRNSLQN